MSGTLFWAGAGIAIIVGAGVVLATELRRRDGTGPGPDGAGPDGGGSGSGSGSGRLTPRPIGQAASSATRSSSPVVAHQGPQPGDDAPTILVVADALEPEGAVVVDDGHARATGAER